MRRWRFGRVGGAARRLPGLQLLGHVYLLLQRVGILVFAPLLLLNVPQDTIVQSQAGSLRSEAIPSFQSI